MLAGGVKRAKNPFTTTCCPARVNTLSRSKGKQMIYAIATRQNSDGTYDAVGMNNRILIKHNTMPWIKRSAQNIWIHNFEAKKTRVEVFYGSIYNDKPDMVYYLGGNK